MKNNTPSNHNQAQSPINTDAFHRLLGFADAEWKGIMRLGRYCGLGLTDCARLKSWNLSQDKQMLLLKVPNVKHLLKFPLGPKLTDYLMTLPNPTTPDTPLFPNCYSTEQSGLEAEFNRLLERTDKAYSDLDFSSLHYCFHRLRTHHNLRKHAT